MKTLKITIISFLMISAIAAHAQLNKRTKVTGKEITYTLHGKIFKGYIAYDDAKKGKRPGIVIIHEWWGCNDYVRMRARKLAELGYIAIAADMYGNGKLAGNPQEAQALSAGIYKDMQLLKERVKAAEDKLKTYNQTDRNNIGAIGYCFGGAVVLNAAKLGMDFKGVVSFHGSLAGVAPDKNLLKANLLICHGEADKFVSPEEVNNFKSQLDSIGAQYSFKTYPDANHAFTNPAATQIGKKFNIPIAYNEPADKKSWSDMKLFFNDIFKR